MATEPEALPARRSFKKRFVVVLATVLLAYFALTYVAIPMGWKRYAARHPELDNVPRITYTKSGIPGDPLNVALIGAERSLKKMMLDAHWDPADPLTLKSCLEIAEATVLKRRYNDAPVSNLYLAGRKEDLAFEKPVGKDPRKRHHVRFWLVPDANVDGQPVWVGSVTYDERVGFSHTTGQITHHIGPNVDAERDALFQDLEQTGRLSGVDVVPEFHTVLDGRNGGGDPWHTDGSLWAGVIAGD